ncbi:MAG: SDR family NAD(P)-dependent oxidoreductase [Gordonia sp. (in: high G+C Gram-positive bacteria)]
MPEPTLNHHSAHKYVLPDGRIPVVISADAEAGVGRFAAAIATFLRANPGLDAQRVADYLLDARPVRRHRAIAAVSDRTELLEALDALTDGRSYPCVVRGTASSHRFAYVYPGQGGQRPGMGAVDYAHSAAYRAAVDECHAESMALFGTSPIDYVLGRRGTTQTDDVRVVQPALFMHMLGLTAMWDDAGVRPEMTVGHSQGEIAAAVRSGIATLRDGLVVVTARARAVDAVAPRGYTMAVLGIDIDEAEALLARNSGWMELSVVNSAHILCVSGERDAVVSLVESLTAEGKFAKEIRVAYPAHTSIVSKFRDELAPNFDRYGLGELFGPAKIPCVGATLGEAIAETMPIRDYWFWNLRNRVRFDRAITTAVDSGADRFIEIAEHPTLVLAMSETLADHPNTEIIATRRRECTDLELFTRNVLTVAVSDQRFHWTAWATEDSGASPARALPLEGFPNSPMRRVHHWAPFIDGIDDAANQPGWASPGVDHDVRALRTAWERPASRKLVAPQKIALLTMDDADHRAAEEICLRAPDHGARAWQGSGAGADAALLLLPVGRGVGLLSDVLTELDLVELPAMLWVATTGAETVAPTEIADAGHAAVMAGLRCLAAERPGLRIAQLDLPIGGASADDILSAIHVGGESAVVLRDGATLVKRLVPVDVSDQQVPAVTHAVITGGTGRVGLAMAERIAHDGARRITLLSRSGGNKEARRTARRIAHRFGVVVDLRRCDLTDETSVVAAVGDLGKVDLLVHAALDYVAGPLTSFTPADVARAFGAKVDGLSRIMAALNGFGKDGGGRVLICSSLAATIGGRDQALYAAANRLLEVEAAHLRANGIDAVAIGWGLWAVQGPLDADGVERVTSTGVVPMAPTAALDVGLRVTEDAQVLAATWPDLRDLLSVLGMSSLIAEVPDLRVSVPEVGQPEPSPESVAAEAIPMTLSTDIPLAGIPSSDVPSEDLTAGLVEELAVAMGLAASDIDLTTPLVALGVDSLQALDFRKRVQGRLSRDLPVEAILGGASLADVVEILDAA